MNQPPPNTPHYNIYEYSREKCGSLSDALIKGERINSNEWHFAGMAGQLSADGYIVKGIEADEGFVLNSKRRWISWLLDDKPALNCR